MATGYTLPPPTALEIHNPQAADKLKMFKRAWTNYSLATELTVKTEAIQVAILLTVIGEEAQEVFSTFNDWARAGDETKLSQYCRNLNSTVSHTEMSLLRDISLIVVYKRQEKPIISTVQHYVNWQKDAIFKLSHQMTS